MADPKTGKSKHLGIDSNAYFRDILTRLPTHPADRLEELLPHRWQAACLAATAPGPDPPPPLGAPPPAT